MSALAVVRWLTLNDPDVATELLDHRTRTLHALQAEAGINAEAFADGMRRVAKLTSTTSAEAAAAVERIRQAGMVQEVFNPYERREFGTIRPQPDPYLAPAIARLELNVTAGARRALQRQLAQLGEPEKPHGP